MQHQVLPVEVLDHGRKVTPNDLWPWIIQTLSRHFVGRSALMWPLSGLNLRRGFNLMLINQRASSKLENPSQGTIKISDSNPFNSPKIDPNYFSVHQDLVDYRNAIKKSREQFTHPLLKDHIGEEYTPGPRSVPSTIRWALNTSFSRFDTDEEIDNHLINTVETCYHPVGGCCLGESDDGALDAEFKVKGIESLRVVDASVMPDLPSGNTNAPTIMLAEVCADLMHWNLFQFLEINWFYSIKTETADWNLVIFAISSFNGIGSFWNKT